MTTHRLFVWILLSALEVRCAIISRTPFFYNDAHFVLLESDNPLSQISAGKKCDQEGGGMALSDIPSTFYLNSLSAYMSIDAGIDLSVTDTWVHGKTSEPIGELIEPGFNDTYDCFSHWTMIVEATDPANTISNCPLRLCAFDHNLTVVMQKACDDKIPKVNVLNFQPSSNQICQKICPEGDPQLASFTEGGFEVHYYDLPNCTFLTTFGVLSNYQMYVTGCPKDAIYHALCSNTTLVNPPTTQADTTTVEPTTVVTTTLEPTTADPTTLEPTTTLEQTTLDPTTTTVTTTTTVQQSTTIDSTTVLTTTLNAESTPVNQDTTYSSDIPSRTTDLGQSSSTQFTILTDPFSTTAFTSAAETTAQSTTLAGNDPAISGTPQRVNPTTTIQPLIGSSNPETSTSAGTSTSTLSPSLDAASTRQSSISSSESTTDASQSTTTLHFVSTESTLFDSNITYPSPLDEYVNCSGGDTLWSNEQLCMSHKHVQHMDGKKPIFIDMPLPTFYLRQFFIMEKKPPSKTTEAPYAAFTGGVIWVFVILEILFFIFMDTAPSRRKRVYKKKKNWYDMD